MNRVLPALMMVAAWSVPLAAQGPTLPDNPLAGRLLFQSKRCNHCHGLSGIRPGIAFDLGEGHFEGTFLDQGASLWNHVPGMSVTFERAGLDWPSLSEREAEQLFAFLYFMDYLGRPGEAARGADLFARRGCADCHTLDDRGAAVGPDLGALRRHASPLFIAGAIWNHGPAMLESLALSGMEPPTFEEGDLADLAAFARQEAAPGPSERQLLAPGNPNRGAGLFRSKGCATCHGENGRGGDIGPDLAAADLHRSAAGIAGTMWNHALEMRQIMRRRGVGWPEFETGELADLVAFLYFLPFSDPPGDPALGARLFDDRGCAGCHGGADATAPDLAASEAVRGPVALVSAMWNHAPMMKEEILAEGRHWPQLTGEELRALLAFVASER